MLPVTTAREKYSNDHQLRLTARNRAYENTYHDIYRHMMRYETDEVADFLDLSESDIKIFKRYTNMQEEMELPVKFVTINLPSDWVITDTKLIDRCLKKRYVGEWYYAFELGPSEDHPHYHVIFTSTVKWLAKSRIISEWATIFDVDKNFINVKPTSKKAIPKLLNYIGKEGVTPIKSNKLDNIIKHNNTDAIPKSIQEKVKLQKKATRKESL